MTPEKLKEQVLKNKDVDLEEMLCFLTNYIDDIEFHDAEESGNGQDIEIYFSNEDKHVISDAIVHVFLDDEVLEDEELFDEILDNCKRENYHNLIKHSICYYVIVTDENGEICGHEEFGFSDEEWKKLISR